MDILHSRIVGEGKPLLILHGYFGMGDNWKSHANAFAANGFQVHLIDQRNHGRSFHSDAFSYPLLVADLLRYMEFHSIEKPHVIGHSMGGKTAMLFAVEYPEMLDKLVVVDISPRAYPPHHNEILNALHSVDFKLQNTRKLIDAKLAELIPEMGVRQFLLKSVYWKEKGVLDFRFNLKSLIENNKEVGVALPSFTSFAGNMLFLSGANSGYITTEDIPLIRIHFPKAKMVEIPDAGHWLHAEQPKAFFDNVMYFL